MSDLPVGAYVASALMAANYPGDSGEDVDRFLAELDKRGYRVTRAASEDLRDHEWCVPHDHVDHTGDVTGYIQPAAPAEGPLTPEEAEGWRTYAKRQGERGKPVVVNPVEFLGLLDRMTAPSEGLHHHDVNGVALWFDGTGGKPVGGPADD